MKLYSVKFRVNQDELTGEWGLQPVACPTFNASWSALMLFHDVFEHWFEHQHKYFTADAAENIGGEMCAMGALWYLYETFDINERLPSYGYNDPQTVVAGTTEYFFQEDNVTYGSELISKVPYQRPINGSDIEYIIKKVFDNVKNVNSEYIADPKEFKALKEFATFGKIANLHRYGYNMAARMFPDNQHNHQFFVDFWQYWSAFFRINSDPEQFHLERLQINISKEKGNLRWSAYWEGKRLPNDYPPDLYEFLIEKGVFF